MTRTASISLRRNSSRSLYALISLTLYAVAALEARSLLMSYTDANSSTDDSAHAALWKLHAPPTPITPNLTGPILLSMPRVMPSSLKGRAYDSWEHQHALLPTRSSWTGAAPAWRSPRPRAIRCRFWPLTGW